MKKILISLFLLTFSYQLFSQWGIKGGVNISNFDSYQFADDLISVHVGGTYDYQLSKNWYFQPSLLFSTVGFKIKDDKVFSKGGFVKIHALETPLNLSFRPRLVNNVKILTDIGLYARYGLFGKDSYEYYSETAKITENVFDAYSRFDTGLNLGLGLQQKQCTGMLSFYRGLSHAERGIQVYHKVIRFSVGYMF